MTAHIATGPAAPGRFASVIVVCPDRACLAALARHTRRPWELIVVREGHDAEFAAYLGGLADAAAFPVVVLDAPGPGAGVGPFDVGVTAASGGLIALLDGSAVVTDAWLDQLEALLAAGPSIGLAAPMSDAADPPQRVAGAPGADPEALDAFAARWRAGQRGRWSEAATLSGPCLLIHREAWEAAGSAAGPGGTRSFADLARRARAAGFASAVAHDLFIHGGGPAELPGPSAAVAGPRPRVSLTMIVRDEEENLPACLESARGLFDQLVVVDTGSNDRTVEVARSFGAEVFAFPWVDDFAAARNAALGHASGEYAFWLDADDRIEPDQRPRLEALLGRLRPGNPAAYVVRCACDPGGEGGGVTVVDHVRLFPLRDDVRWEYRVHEQILPSLRRSGVPVRWSDATVRHTGYADPATRGRKLDRDRAILEAEAEARPGDPFVHFNLGFIAVELGRWEEAVPHLERSLAGSAEGDSITGKLHALLARAQQSLGRPREALATCVRGLAARPADAELLFRKALLHRQMGEPAAAEACWRRVLGLEPPERFSSLDAGIYGHLTRRNLGVLAAERGDLAEAIRQWEAVLATCPADPEALGVLEALGRVVAPAARPGVAGQGGAAGLPDFDVRGMLPPGDYPLTLAGLRDSALVGGPAGREGWDATWRAQLVDNLEVLAHQLWAVGVEEIYLGGSFASSAGRPQDLDGYFVCERLAYKARVLHDALNAQDPHRAWTWSREDRRPDERGRLRLPMWLRYRVELFPYYGQGHTNVSDGAGGDVNFPRLFRHAHDGSPRGVIRLMPGADAPRWTS